MCSRTAGIQYISIRITKPFFNLICEPFLFKTCKMTRLQLGGSCLACETTSDIHVKQDRNTGRTENIPTVP